MKFSFIEKYFDDGQVSVSEIFKVERDFKPVHFEKPNFDTYQDVYDTWEDANIARLKLIDTSQIF